ncbi:hypothetical protein GW17_00060239 [Ensete ventricosum]|nr:hypothetical protein GW17_00060239 [Ensete ventricosum]
MHPLRFPNSGIKAKVFMRKFGFKLGFRAIVTVIGSESRRCLWGRGDHMNVVCMQRWLAMARPPAGVVGYGLATYKDRSVAVGPLQGAIAHRVSSRQGAVTRGHGRLPLAGAMAPIAKGNRHLRRGSGGGAVRVKEG